MTTVMPSNMTTQNQYVHTMRTYHDMHKKFTDTRKPPRSKKYMENQRPLRRVPESWLMLQKDPHSYVVKINGQEVARYFEPDEDGNYQVAIRNLYATHDLHLMWVYTRIYSRMQLRTTNGDIVLVPLNPFYDKQGKEFSAVLTFDSSHQLIVEKSWHSDVFKKVSTTEDKDRRKNLKSQLDAYVTLQMFKLPTLKDNAEVSHGEGAPFGEERLDYRKSLEMKEFLSMPVVPVETPTFGQLFDEVSQDVFNMLASKKIYKVDDRLFWKARAHFATHNTADTQDAAKAQIAEIIQSVTPDEHKKSLVARLMKYASLKQGTQSVALPQFPNVLPNSFYLTT